MRIDIFSDIHGNPFATRAVLDAIAADGQFDAVVIAGDVCLGGSDSEPQSIARNSSKTAPHAHSHAAAAPE